MVQNINQTYIRNGMIDTAHMGEELGMLNVETGKYFILDPIASNIWTALEEPMTMNHLVNHLMSIYDVDQDTCIADTEMFLSEMIKNELIKPLTLQE